jgi:hypothetical protein
VSPRILRWLLIFGDFFAVNLGLSRCLDKGLEDPREFFSAVFTTTFAKKKESFSE